MKVSLFHIITFTNLLISRKSLLAGDSSAKHPFWNNLVSIPSGAKLVNLLRINGIEISATLRGHT
jgi:hypothetical protein